MTYSTFFTNTFRRISKYRITHINDNGGYRQWFIGCFTDSVPPPISLAFFRFYLLVESELVVDSELFDRAHPYQSAF